MLRSSCARIWAVIVLMLLRSVRAYTFDFDGMSSREALSVAQNVTDYCANITGVEIIARLANSNAINILFVHDNSTDKKSMMEARLCVMNNYRGSRIVSTIRREDYPNLYQELAEAMVTPEENDEHLALMSELSNNADKNSQNVLATDYDRQHPDVKGSYIGGGWISVLQQWINQY